MGDASDGRNEIQMEDSELAQEPMKQTEAPPIRKPTFKEKVLGVKPVLIPEEVDLLETGVMKMDLVEGNRLFPSFDMDDTAYKSICHPFEDCLVIKLLGKKIGYRTLCERLKSLWKLNGSFEVIEVHNGYFFVKFDSQEDKVKVLTGAPWMIFDHYLSVKPWTSDFVAADSKINTTAVWIRIPGLGLQFYHRKILMTLAKGVGKPIKVDMNTVDMHKGRFARVCVEIDLSEPVVGMIRLRGTWYKVEYEGLHLLCGACGCYGHLTRNCSASPVQTQPKQQAEGVPNAAVAVTVTEVMTAQVDTPAGQSQGCETPNLQSAEIQGNNNVPEKCPDSAHGEWLKVERKRNKPKKVAPSKEEYFQFTGKGNKSKAAGNTLGVSKKGGNNISNDLPTASNKEYSYSSGSVQYRKRPRNAKPQTLGNNGTGHGENNMHVGLMNDGGIQAKQLSQQQGQTRKLIFPQGTPLSGATSSGHGGLPPVGKTRPDTGEAPGAQLLGNASMERRTFDNIVLPKDVIFKDHGGA
ncbi:uncharacterized protein LOC130725505 [Lotus japonicus]|uniref:uncharacterized protein LOC130725505 n=1 Tax=Lotus japonicus TaxID=34305 RepID=UPI002587DF40|nr:uncharacterized protein LOC130725505 [Lotus japonicus]